MYPGVRMFEGTVSPVQLNFGAIVPDTVTVTVALQLSLSAAAGIGLRL
jgi:hypothetical protein